MIVKFPLLLLCCVLLGLAGCAGMPVPGASSDPFDGLSQQDADNLRLREKNMLRVFNPELEGYLHRVLTKLYGEEELQSRNVRIALVSVADPGASVMEDGLVVWYLGTFDYLKNEDEVAAILAHEMAHLTEGHHAITNTGSVMDKLMAAGEAAALFSGAGSTVELWAAANTARWASDSVLFPAFTREQETQADVAAAKTLVEAGYNADAVRTMLGALRSYYGEQKEFRAEKMFDFSTQEMANNGTRINLDFDPEAIIGNVKGFAESRWGQAYETYTEREGTVRELLITEYPQRKRGQFMESTHKQVLQADGVKQWLDAHKVGFEFMAMEIRDQNDVSAFHQYVSKLREDPLTSPVFDHEAIINAALKNNQGMVVKNMSASLMNADQGLFDHYMKYAGYERQQGNYEQALAAYSAADEIFSSSMDRVIVPLILATKDDAGIKQGTTALRCLDPSLMMACLYRK